MIRLAKTNDLDQIDALSLKTIKDMRAKAIKQWDTTYPRKTHFAEDIEKEALYVYEKKGKILGAMAVLPGDEKAYRDLPWMRDESFAVHRIVVDPDAQRRGVATALFLWLFAKAKKEGVESIRIDTHPANSRMLGFLKRLQFEYIGYIPSIHRLAYERLVGEAFLKRTIILGSSGSGKTTLARMIGEKLAVPILHLDTVYWEKDWTPIDGALFQEKVRRFMRENPRFVMDGNYLHTPTFADRLHYADTVILLSYDRKEALKGIIEREAKYKHRHRSDMAEGCDEDIDQEFLQYVYFFDDRRKRIEGIVKTIAHKKHFLRFSTREALDHWLATL